jgi:hypothetical protein
VVGRFFLHGSHSEWSKEGVLSCLQKASSEDLDSREMQIALSKHIFLDRIYDWNIDIFFFEKFPNTIKEAMRLGFGSCLNYANEEHPHWKQLLEYMNEKEEWQEFYDICTKLRNHYQKLKDEAEEAWKKIPSDMSFEQSLMAAALLHCIRFGHSILDDTYNKNTANRGVRYVSGLNAYLNKTRELKNYECNSDLWKDRQDMGKFLINYYIFLLIDSRKLDNSILGKIYKYVLAQIELNSFYEGPCETFIFDNGAKIDIKNSKYTYNNEQDDSICYSKIMLLFRYYYEKNYEAIQNHIAILKKNSTGFEKHNYMSIPEALYIFYEILKEYYGTSDIFTFDGHNYDLKEILCLNNKFTSDIISLYVKKMETFFQKYSSQRQKQTIDLFLNHLVQKCEIPVHINNISYMFPDKCKEFNILYMDLANTEKEQKKPIDLMSLGSLKYGNSDVCITFPYIRGMEGNACINLLNLLRRSDNYDKTSDAKRVENTVYDLFNNFSIFKENVQRNIPYIYENEDGKSSNRELDVIIYKDNILILVEVKSTYSIRELDDRHEFEKKLYYAAHQLNLGEKSIRADKSILEKITGNPNIVIDDIKRIEKIIVSTSPEFDYKEFEGCLKVSLLDLMIILRDEVHYFITEFPNKEIEDSVKNLQRSGANELAENMKLYCKNTKFVNEEVANDCIAHHGCLELLHKEFSLYKESDTSIDDFLQILHSNIWENKILPYWPQYQKLEKVELSLFG